MPTEILQADLGDPAHCAGVLEILDSYASDPIGGGQGLAADARARLIPGLREHAGSLVFLAFDAGRPVGVAVCFVGFSTFQARPLLNVHDLAVLPDRRGGGIGRALLEAVQQRALDLGCCKITLEVVQDNTRARSLYKSFGFGDFMTGSHSTPTLFLEKRIHPPR